MAKKNTTSTDTNPALPTAPLRRTAKKSAAETATNAAGDSVARHRKATPAKSAVQPEVAAVSAPVEVAPVATFSEPAVTLSDQAPAISITQEDIARLAFSFFEQRGYQGGSPEGDWLRAEQELMQLV